LSISSFPQPTETTDLPEPLVAERRERFETLFRRSPTPRELARFNNSHERLLLRLPARARRRAARIIATL